MITRKTLIALSVLAALSSAALAAQKVGEVSLVIGEARLARKDGELVAVARNMAIEPGDRIETAAGGHVHVRFIDGGMVSVRPESRLVVESYEREGAAQGGAIKFRLDRGAVRSVTGEWGEANRERFRLNTPIAAIGVRGTDFVVQADADRLRAAVVSGAIVVAPYGDGCKAEMLGPCATQQAATLAAEMGNVMVELKRQESAPRIVPLSNLQLSAVSALRSDDAGKTRSGSPAPQDSLNESRAGRIVVGQSGSSPTPGVPEPVLLAWGRWGAARAGDTMTVTQLEARDDGNRQIATGSLDSYYLLYRSNGYDAYFPASLGEANFGFSAGQAHLMQGSTALPVSVQGGVLSINFASGQFSTALSLSQQQLGDWKMSAAGTVDNKGILLYRGTDGAYVTGAVSTNAAKAAYSFGQMTDLGLVTGIANWSRR